MNKTQLKELIKKSHMKEGATVPWLSQDKNNSEASLDALEAKLKSHNWFHYQSDGRVYDEGMAQKKEIQDMLKALQGKGLGDAAKELYNKYAPYEEGGVNLRLKEEDMGLEEDEDLTLTFRDKNEFQKAKEHFESNSEFYPEYISDEFKSFHFKVQDQADADSTEYYLTQELEGTTDLNGYFFALEPSMMNEKTHTFPDMTGDGKVTRADILKARGVDLKKSKGEIDESGYREMTPSERANKQRMDNQLKNLSNLKKSQEDKERLFKLQQKIHKDRTKSLMKGEELDEDYSPSLRAYNVIDGDRNIVYKNLPRHIAIEKAGEREDYKFTATDSLAEDLDLGHEDNEPHMLKADLYRIGKYAMELYQMVDEFEGKGEVDFPHWWQSKIINAKSNLVGAKHYLDFEIKEPAIDAMVGVASDEEILDDEPMMENIGKDEILAGKIAKALKDMANKDASDQNNLKQARIALNKGNMDAAKKIAKPYLSEKIAKKLKEDLDKETSYEAEISDIIKQKNLQQGDKIKWMFGFSGWRDKTPVEYTGTFIKWGLIMEGGMIKPLIPKYMKSAVGIIARVKNDKFPTKTSYLYYKLDGKSYIEDEQKAFVTLEKI